MKKTINRVGPALVALTLAMATTTGLAIAAGSSGSSSANAAPLSYTIWPNSTVPRVPADPDTNSVQVGVRFTSSASGTVTALRFYKSATNVGRHVGSLWGSNGAVLASATYSNETATGWQEAQLSTPVSIRAGGTYTASYRAPYGHYSDDVGTLSAAKTVTGGALTAIGGVYNYASGIPSQQYQDSNYFVDVRFKPSTSAPSPTTTTTTPSPTTTTTTPPTVSGCASRPSACGYPDESNTGVVAGKALLAVPGQVTSGAGWHWDSRGWVSIDGAGAVFDGYSVNANIDVVANNVTVRNVRMVQGGEGFGISLRHTSGVTIENSVITAPDAAANRLVVGIKDIYGDATGTRVLANDISRTSTGIQVQSGLVEDNYIHDLGMTGGDHVNGTTANGGNTPQLTLHHNTVFNSYSQTDAISLFQDFGPQANRTIDNNLLAGGGYTIYAGANAGKEATATNIHVTNNRISRMYYPQGGSYGPVTAYTSTGGNTFTGNIWDDTGAAIVW